MIGIDLVTLVFFMLGLIIFAGFFSLLFFERTKIPDVLILMTLGALINFAMNYFDPEHHMVNPQIFEEFAPFVGALAFMIILFEGGINLKFYRVLKELPLVTGFTLVIFALNCLFVMLVMMFVFGWSALQALLLGAVIGGTSSAIVIPLISKLYVDDSVKIFLTLESTLTDALSIIVAITVLDVIIVGFADLSDIANSLFSAFSIAGFFALIMGIIWIRILSKFHGKSFGYLLTVAIIFLIYSIVEASRGSGAIAAFIFGLVLGNANDICRVLKMDGNFILSNKIRSFHEEVSFLIRTFFFVYLGLVFEPVMSATIIFISFMVLFALMLARVIPTYFMVRLDENFDNAGILLTTMMPRGLAAAVLASTLQITEKSRGVDIIPDSFMDITVLIIICTSVLATAGVFFYERKRVKANSTGSAEYDILLDSPEQSSSKSEKIIIENDSDATVSLELKQEDFIPATGDERKMVEEPVVERSPEQDVAVESLGESETESVQFDLEVDALLAEENLSKRVKGKEGDKS